MQPPPVDLCSADQVLATTDQDSARTNNIFVSLPIKSFVLAAFVAGTLALAAAGIAVMGINWHSATESAASVTPDEPSTYGAHTGTRPPIVGDIIVTDGTQFAAMSEKDALAAQLGNVSGQTMNSKYLGFNRHLSVLNVSDRVVHVRVIELDREYWLAKGAVWR